MWGEGSVAWLTGHGLGGAGLGGLRPVKVPPRPATVAQGVLVGWSAARVERGGRPWRSARELALDPEQWAVRVRDERGASRERFPDLAVWPRDSSAPVALIVHAGLRRADRQRAILKGWRDAVESGQYAGVGYDCTSESVAKRIAYLAETVGLTAKQCFVTVQPTRDEIVAAATDDLRPEHADQPVLITQAAADANEAVDAVDAVQLQLLPTPALTPVEMREPAPTPQAESRPTPAPDSCVTAEERQRRYREALGIPDEKRRRRWGGL
jgi:hypothetical protein